MTRKFLLVLLLTICFSAVTAQKKMVFTNVNSGKIEIVNEGDMLKVVYLGYLGQVQEMYGRVDNINDSLVRFENEWHVRVGDIIGFRKFNKYRDIYKGVFEITTLVGGIIAFSAVVANNNFSPLQRIGISFGIGIGISALNSLLFSERVKNYMYSGWAVKVE